MIANVLNFIRRYVNKIEIFVKAVIGTKSSWVAIAIYKSQNYQCIYRSHVCLLVQFALDLLQVRAVGPIYDNLSENEAGSRRRS